MSEDPVLSYTVEHTRFNERAQAVEATVITLHRSGRRTARRIQGDPRVVRREVRRVHQHFANELRAAELVRCPRG